MAARERARAVEIRRRAGVQAVLDQHRIPAAGQRRLVLDLGIEDAQQIVDHRGCFARAAVERRPAGPRQVHALARGQEQVEDQLARIQAHAEIATAPPGGGDIEGAGGDQARERAVESEHGDHGMGRMAQGGERCDGDAAARPGRGELILHEHAAEVLADGAQVGVGGLARDGGDGAAHER